MEFHTKLGSDFIFYFAFVDKGMLIEMRMIFCILIYYAIIFSYEIICKISYY